MSYLRRIPHDYVIACDTSVDKETASAFIDKLSISEVGKGEGKLLREEGSRFYKALRRAIYDKDIQAKLPAEMLASIIELCDRMDCRKV